MFKIIEVRPGQLITGIYVSGPNAAPGVEVTIPWAQLPRAGLVEGGQLLDDTLIDPAQEQ